MKFEEIKNSLCLLSEHNEEYKKFVNLFNKYKKIILIGNGGSNAICSHIAQDYTKNAKKIAISFSDSSRLTCYINDYGINDAYCKFIEHFYDHDTAVILISSSGNSQNILNSAKFCLDNNINFGILSGFEKKNKLRSLYSEFSAFDFYVESNDYGVVECMHQIFLHGVV